MAARSRASAYGEPIPVDEIPDPVTDSSYYAAYQEGASPGALVASSSSGSKIKRERIEGAIDMEYYEYTGDALYGATPRFGYIEGLLAPFMTSPPFSKYYGAVAIV